MASMMTIEPEIPIIASGVTGLTPSSSCLTLGFTGGGVTRQRRYPDTKSVALGDLRVSKRMAPLPRDGAKRFALRYGEQLVAPPLIHRST